MDMTGKNAFEIMGVATKYLRLIGTPEAVAPARELMMEGDYENLCEVAKYVTHGYITFEETPEYELYDEEEDY